MVSGLNRAIVLQAFDLTKSKQKTITDFSRKAVVLANSLLKQRKSKRLMDLHKAAYSASKKNTSFNSQVICDIERNVVRSKATIIKRITVKFNVPRNCKTFNTKANFFVELGTYPRKPIAIPIKKNRNYQRFISLLATGWGCKTFGLTCSGQIVAYLSKEETELPQRKNILGIDTNAKCFAVSVLSPEGKVLKQTYFGKDIWVQRKKIMAHRALLQSLADKGSFKARRKLIRFKTKERNFIKNRLGEIVKDITNMALSFDADIAIENLKKFPIIKSKKGKAHKINQKIMRIPFAKFREILTSRCFDKNIILEVVDSWHTSKWCSHCGALANGHDNSNYSLFKCKCGQVVNSDRKASLAVAVKSLLERNIQATNHSLFFQFSSRRVAVNQLFCRNDGFVSNDAVHLEHSPIETA